MDFSNFNDKQIRELIDIIDIRIENKLTNSRNIVSSQVGTITAINGTNLSVRLQGDTTSIVFQNKSANSSPSVNDSAVVLKINNTLNDAFVAFIF